MKYWIVIDEIYMSDEFIHVRWKGSIDGDEFHYKSVIGLNELKEENLEKAIFSWLYKELEKSHAGSEKKKEQVRKLESMKGKKYDDETWVLAEKLDK